MVNLIEITPNCYIIRSQAGFKKLCNKLHCSIIPRKKDYWCKIYQITKDSKAFIEETHIQCNNDTGTVIKDENGKENTYIIKRSVQYPIKYPCILSYLDNTFESCYYEFYIKYVYDDLKIKDFQNSSEECKRFEHEL